MSVGYIHFASSRQDLAASRNMTKIKHFTTLCNETCRGDASGALNQADLEGGIPEPPCSLFGTRCHLPHTLHSYHRSDGTGQAPFQYFPPCNQGCYRTLHAWPSFGRARECPATHRTVSSPGIYRWSELSYNSGHKSSPPPQEHWYNQHT